MRIARVLVGIMLLSLSISCGAALQPTRMMYSNHIGDQIRSTPGFVREGNALHARGGRAGEISYMVDGIEIKDPLISENNQRMVVTNAFISLDSKIPDSVHAKVVDIAAKHKGYVLVSQLGSTSIRIPALDYREAIQEIELLGKVKEKNLSGEDVTDNYKDLETGLDSAEKAAPDISLCWIKLSWSRKSFLSSER